MKVYIYENLISMKHHEKYLEITDVLSVSESVHHGINIETIKTQYVFPASVFIKAIMEGNDDE